MKTREKKVAEASLLDKQGNDDEGDALLGYSGSFASIL
jgi:hypothetical protein